MHEFSLMKDLMGKITAVAEDQNARRVTRVEVWLGALSHMSGEHFTEHFEHSARGTLAEGARLDIQTSTDLADPQAADVRLLSIDLK